MSTRSAHHGHVFKKLTVAVANLATSHGTLASRLAGTTRALRALSHPSTAWASPDDRARLDEILHRVGNMPVAGQNAADPDVMRITLREQKAIAEEIWSLYLDYAQLDAEARCQIALTS